MSTLIYFIQLFTVFKPHSIAALNRSGVETLFIVTYFKARFEGGSKALQTSNMCHEKHVLMFDGYVDQYSNVYSYEWVYPHLFDLSR